MLFASKKAYISKRKVAELGAKEPEPLLNEVNEMDNESDNSCSSIAEGELDRFHSSEDEKEEMPVEKSAPAVPKVADPGVTKPEPKKQRLPSVEGSMSSNSDSLDSFGDGEQLEQLQQDQQQQVQQLPQIQQLQQFRQQEPVPQQKRGKRKPRVQKTQLVQQRQRKRSISSSGSDDDQLMTNIRRGRQAKGNPSGGAKLERKRSLTNIVVSSDEDEEEHVIAQKKQESQLSKGAKRMQEASKRQRRVFFNKTAEKKVKKPEAKKGPEKHYKQEVDTNVLAFDLSVLKNEKDIFTGDPVFCKHCKGVLNVYSQIIKEEEKKEQIWPCEFCGCPNEIQIEAEDQPKSDELTYILEAAPIKEEKKVEKGEELKISEERNTVIFCVDVSGSMDTPQTIKVGEVPIDQLRELMRSMGYRYKDWKMRDKITLERLNCIKLALERQVAKLAKEAPNVELGIVTFESSLEFIGDAASTPKRYNSEKFKNYKNLIQIAQADAKVLMASSVSACKDKLIERLRKMKTLGGTALGPGLAVALGAAFKGGPGSKIILCTDGESNEGPGSIGYSEKDKAAAAAFYKDIAEMAKERGVVISLISIVGDSCRLDLMSSLAELTGGEIVKVNPINLVSEFDTLISENIIATNVELRVKLHKGLSFRNENPANLTEDASLLIKSLGNVTAEEEVTVEYHTKSRKKLKILEIDFSKITSLPFQAQITYFTLSGAKCLRLITKKQDITFEKEVAKKEADFKIIASNAVKQSSKLAKEGNIKKSQAAALHWRKMLKGTEVYEDYMVNMAPLYNALEQQQEPSAAAADWLVSETNQASRWTSAQIGKKQP